MGTRQHSSSTKDPLSHPKVGKQFRRSWHCKHACAPDIVGLPRSLLIMSLALHFLPILASSWAWTPCTCSDEYHLLPNSNWNGYITEEISALPTRLLLTPKSFRYGSEDTIFSSRGSSLYPSPPLLKVDLYCSLCSDISFTA